MEKKKTGQESKKESTFFKDYQNLYLSAERLRKDTEGFNYKYVQLKDVLAQAKKLCVENNFIFIQTPAFSNEFQGELKPILRTELRHISGEKIIAETPLPTKDPNNPQKVGGAITYMRRYSLTSILGLEEEDDDAQEASTEKKDTKKENESSLDKMKKILFQMGAKDEEQAIKIINGLPGNESVALSMKDVTEMEAKKIIKLLRDED
jgi:hypothetical protein